MRNFAARTLALAAALCLLGAQGVTAKPRSAKTPDFPQIRLKDGLYAIADGGVVCKVSRGRINCRNAEGAQITCIEDHCVAHETSKPSRDLDIGVKAKNAPKRVLPANVDLDLPQVSCFAGLHFIECGLVDWEGGFQMSRRFARCNNWDDAPWGWPWDGHKYGKKDLIPGAG
jgi:hypothetical protein